MTGRRGTWKHGLGTAGHFQPDGVGLAFLCGTEDRWERLRFHTSGACHPRLLKLSSISNQPQRLKGGKNTFLTGRIHQNELAAPISLKQQFATLWVTNLSGDIISQETTQDKFLAQYDSSLLYLLPHVKKI